MKKDNSIHKVEKAKKTGLKALIAALALAVTMSGVGIHQISKRNHDEVKPGIETEQTEDHTHEHNNGTDSENTEDVTEDNTVTEDPVHVHVWSDWEFFNEIEEVHTCECGEKEYQNHEFSEWIKNDDNTESRECNSCGYVLTRAIQHEHVFSDWASISDTQEARECECGEKEYRSHAFTNWVLGNDGKETRRCETCDLAQTRDVEHKHQWSKWSYLNDDLEQRTCSCGEVETRSHTLGHEKISFESNNNGTHQIVSSRHCKNCNLDIVQESTVSCDMGTYTYNKVTGLEESTCRDCGYTITRSHVHSSVPSDLKYGNATSNNDGTHNLHASYTCTVCEDIITLTKMNTCEYGPWVSNNNGTESRSCNECGYVQTRDVAHTHNWSNWEYFNTNYEQRTCSCGETETRGHSLGNKVYSYVSNNDGTHQKVATQECNTCDGSLETKVNQNCDMSAWTYNRTTGLEESTCKDCGYTVTRQHSHSVAPSNLVYGNAVPNNDGTHTLSASYNCSGCGEKITLTKQENCQMSGWTYNKTTGLEERKCGCGYTETREHTHSAAPSNLVYGNATTNNNGTHDLHASYTCSGCGETITLTKTVNCEYTNWVDHGSYHSHECKHCGYTQRNEHYPNSAGIQVSQSSKTDVHNESYVCGECGITITREVACTSDKTTNIEVVDGVVMEHSYCTSCGAKCDQRSHSHSYSDWSFQDETYEVRSCSCGHGVETRVHSYGELTYDESRQAFVQTCSGCGHEKVRAHTHSYGNTTIQASDSEDVCYYEVSSCDCGDVEKVPVGHDTYERTLAGKTYILCHNCDMRVLKTETVENTVSTTSITEEQYNAIVENLYYEEEEELENIEDKPKTLSLIP